MLSKLAQTVFNVHLLAFETSTNLLHLYFRFYRIVKIKATFGKAMRLHVQNNPTFEAFKKKKKIIYKPAKSILLKLYLHM